MYDYYNFCLKARGAWPSVECLEDLSFVLYYVPEKGCLQAKRYFRWDEREEVKKDEKLQKIFAHFSLRDSFLKQVRESRIKGKKHWKKRRWKLPLKVNNDIRAINVINAINDTNKVSVNNLNWALNYAAKNQDLNSFEVYLEAYRKLNKDRKSKKTILKEFVDKVEKMK